MQNLNQIGTPQEGEYPVVHNGKEYRCQRVTTILERNSQTPYQIMRWMVNCAVEYAAAHPDIKDIKELKASAWSAHQEVSNKALEDGSQVHHAIDTNDESNLTTDAARACWRSYQAWLPTFIPVKIASELSLYDTANLCAGTLDFIGLSGKDKAKKKTLWLLDWKTSSQISRNYKIQVTVYKHMLLLLIKDVLKNPNRYSEQIQRIVNDIVLACGKKPVIKLKVVRLVKTANPTKIKYEECDISKQEEKEYLAEFKLMLKINQIRKESKNANSNSKQ